jgi:putative membrane protein
MRFLARLFLNGVAILVAAWFLPGLEVEGPESALMAGAILGLVNALVRPVLFVLTLPLTLLTLGLFLFVLNAACLWLTAWLVPGFHVAGLGWAVAGALLVGVVSWRLSGVFIGPTERRLR